MSAFNRALLLVVLAAGTSHAGALASEVVKLQTFCARSDSGACESCNPTDGGINLCALAAEPALADVAELAEPAEARQVIAAIKATVTPGGPTVKAAPVEVDLAAMVSDFAVRLIQGLAKLIVDRAQREAAAFLLTELGRQVCADVKRAEWFQSTCALAGDEHDFSAFGSGAPAFDYLRAALEADLRRVPAHTARLVVEETLKASSRVGEIPDAVEQAVLQLEDGVWFFQATRPVAAAIHAENQKPLSNNTTSPDAGRQWLACSLDVVGEFITLDQSLDSDPSPSRTRAVAVASLLRSTPCATMLKTPAYVGKYPKLNRLMELHGAVARIGGRIEPPLRSLVLAIKATRESGSSVQAGDGGVDLDATAARRREALLAAGLSISESSIDLAMALLDSFEELKGLVDSTYAGSATQPIELSRFKKALRFAREVLAVTRAASQKDWATAAIRAYRLALDACPSCTNVLKPDSNLNTLFAIASAKDSEEMARTLDSLATPIGEWKSKQTCGRWTVSLTAHAGVSAGNEWRFGQYGALLEKGGHSWAAPSLSLPVGLEVALGLGRVSMALLVSILDPAAFLQYDVAQGGTLPIPSLVTVLAPGAHLRFGFASPFGVGLFGTIRPGFRRFDSALTSPGATAYQVGLEATIDVTLWTLFRGGK